MKCYELFLDESGDFLEGIEEKSKKKKPSLIGGYLIEVGKMSKEKAEIILGKSYVHMCEESRTTNSLDKTDPIAILQKITDIGGKVVIFQNFERINVLKDRDLLYLNMMAEGVVNLIDELVSLTGEEIKLCVTAAVRKDFKLGYEKRTMINAEEYNKRILEKIYVRLLEKDRLAYNKYNIEFKLASANKDTRLMISDVVCNTRLTIESSKFSKEDRKTLKEFFKASPYIFSVFKTNIQKEIEKSISQNNIADAILKLCELKIEDDYNKLCLSIVTHINKMEMEELNIQIELLSLKVRTILNIYGNLELAERILNTMQNDILPNLSKKSFSISKLELDVSSYLLTIYTHQGNSFKSKKQVDISNELLKKIDGSWDFLNYYFIIKIREAVMYTNALLYKEASDLLEGIVEKADSIIEVIKCIPEFSNLKLDTLGKSLGTRLQAYSRLIPEDKNYYELAVNDSNKAMEQFTSDNDLSRQCLYRGDIECRMGKYDEALVYLARSVKQNEVNYSEILKEIAKIQAFSKHFSVLAYFQIMVCAMENENLELADKLYNAFCQNSNLYKEYLKDDGKIINEYNGEKIILEENLIAHPFELIYWNLGKYMKSKDNNNAKYYFDKAISICDKMQDSTLNVIAIAIECDRLLIQNKCNPSMVCKRFETVYNRNDYLINKALNKIKNDVDDLSKSSDREKVKQICNKIKNKIVI